MNSTGTLVRRLWSLCNVLRDDGISYQDYLSELTYLLFLKLADEQGTEFELPEQYRWSNLRVIADHQLATFYQESLQRLAGSESPIIADIFANAKTNIRSGHSLSRLIRAIESLDWYGATENGMGDVYEGLIEKNAQESRYGAGQYFTPRPLVEALVRVTDPKPSDDVYDPAAGTAGFLVAAGQHAALLHRRPPQLVGNELVPDVRRMALMNLHLHQLKAEIHLGDTFSVAPERAQHSICLTNPPFGVKGGLSADQTRLLDFPTNNKQLAFLQHIYKSLKVGGRAAVVVPENVLFEGGAGALVRTHLLNHFNLHTILRLPTGIFYATGVKTAVLFFARTTSTASTWVYDLRSNGETFTKRRQLERAHLQGFVAAYGSDPLGEARRTRSAGFQEFSREEIRAGEDRLDFEVGQGDVGPIDSPVARLELITKELEGAVEAAREMRALLTGKTPL
ncbi:N-6 DNA methylase [Pseudonocardia xinjiangensis]|uniref:class I SAM-dependent DNA methyltransferase n=1 Tax=Pseudonocardia xinjiangensis TaxID=75289 RepID=UPI003D8B37F7